MEFKTQKRTILATLVLVVIVSIIALILTLTVNLKSPICKPSKNAPTRDLSKLVNIVSHDDGSLVNFAGYLELRQDAFPQYSSEGFIALSLHDIYVTDVDDDRIMLALFLDCSLIGIIFRKDGWLLQAQEIEVELWQGEGQYLDSCTIENVPFNYDCKNNHFACRVQQSFPCIKHNVDDESQPIILAYLTVDAIEIELNSNKSVHARGEFAKPVELCNPSATTTKTAIINTTIITTTTTDLLDG